MMDSLCCWLDSDYANTVSHLFHLFHDHPHIKPSFFLHPPISWKYAFPHSQIHPKCIYVRNPPSPVVEFTPTPCLNKSRRPPPPRIERTNEQISLTPRDDNEFFAFNGGGGGVHPPFWVNPPFHHPNTPPPPPHCIVL